MRRRLRIDLLAAFADSYAGPPRAQPIEPLTSREEEVLTRVPGEERVRSLSIGGCGREAP